MWNTSAYHANCLWHRHGFEVYYPAFAIPIMAPVDEVDVVDKVDVDRVDVVELMVMVMRPFHLCCPGAGSAGPGTTFHF